MGLIEMMAMAVIQIQSIQHAVSMGALIALADDYRTSRTIRACLPGLSSYPFAISAAAFNQELRLGTAGKRQSRMEAIAASLSKVLGLREKPSAADLELTFPAEAGQPLACSLKLQWFAPNSFWVLLLPHEELRSVLKLA